MCQLFDLSYAVPYVSPRSRRAATSTGSATTLPQMEESRKRGASVSDSQDGVSSESWSNPSIVPVAGGANHPGCSKVPLWALSSFQSTPLLMNTFLSIVEHDAELAHWRASHP
eukprot:GGOE01005068.1.p1 GENE.GGOE01005068.1~~GGOE01005068.1.p1  ORF type:complete len:125 (-),score=29.53 GGOE01005068.1:747-1085(-)